MLSTCIAFLFVGLFGFLADWQTEAGRPAKSNKRVHDASGHHPFHVKATQSIGREQLAQTKAVKNSE